MSILNIQISQAGLSGTVPNWAYIQTNNTEAEVLASGFLNASVQQGYAFNTTTMCLVSTKATPDAPTSSVGTYRVLYSGGNWSLTSPGNPGDVVLPTVANTFAHFTDTTGTLSSDAGNFYNAGDIYAGTSGTAGALRSYSSTASRGYLEVKAVANTGNTALTISNAAYGQATTLTIPDCGAASANFILSATSGTVQNITSGNFAVTAGDIRAGQATGGTAGRLFSYSATASAGALIFGHVANVGNFSTTVNSSATIGQSQTLSIPDVGASTGVFMLHPGAAITAGNLVSAGATAHTLVDANIAATNVQLKTNLKAVSVTGLGGGGAGPLTVTADGCTTSSLVWVAISASSNVVSVARVVPGTGNFALTLSGDPGATLSINYWMAIAAQ